MVRGGGVGWWGSFSLKKPNSMASSPEYSQNEKYDIANPVGFPEPQNEMYHLSHPQHPLVMVSTPLVFKCVGCKEYGAGCGFACRICTDVHLHDFCVTTSPTLHSHPLHSQHPLLFLCKQGKGGRIWRCEICSKGVHGFAYKCSSCAFVMHPCCAQLSARMETLPHPHPLQLLPAPAGGQRGSDCAHCGRKRSGRVYGCTGCGYYLHAFCAKNMVNGLQANGVDAPERATVLGGAAKVASRVVVGFISGLMEGIGEGVGDVLIGSLDRGRRWNRGSE